MSGYSTSGQSLDDLLAVLFTTLRYRDIVHYTFFSALSLLVFEYFLTVSDEIDLVWRSKWGTGKVLFTLNRYFPPATLAIELSGFLIMMPSKEFCTVWYPFVCVTFLTCIAINQAILTARTWAIWGGEKKALYGLCAGYLVSLGLTGALVGEDLRKSEVYPNPFIMPQGCLIIPDDSHLWAAYVPSVLFETVIFGLTVKKAINMGSIGQGLSPMLAVIIQHGLGYFAVALAISLFNIFIFAFAPQPLLPLGVCFQVTLQSVLCTRLLLDIRLTNRRQSEVPSEWETVKLPPTPGMGLSPVLPKLGYFSAPQTAPPSPMMPNGSPVSIPGTPSMA